MPYRQKPGVRTEIVFVMLRGPDWLDNPKSEIRRIVPPSSSLSVPTSSQRTRRDRL